MLRYVDAALERSDSDYPPPVSNHTRQAGQQRPGPGIPAVIKAPRCASTGRIAGRTASGPGLAPGMPGEQLHGLAEAILRLELRAHLGGALPDP